MNLLSSDLHHYTNLKRASDSQIIIIMKIIFLVTVSMLHAASAASGVDAGLPKANIPGRRGTVLAGGHRASPHSRRTTASTHSEGHQPDQHSRRTNLMTKRHHSPPLDLQLSTRGGATTVVKKPEPAPAPVVSPSSLSRFDIFSPTSGEDLPCPPPQEFLDELGLTADDIDCDQDGGVFIEDECADLYNSTPPCPPTEVLALLNLTLAELDCDSGVLPPCPYPELASQLGLDVDALECDKEFWCFSHHYINANTSTIPCPSDFALFELEMLYGIWCEHDDTKWEWPDEGAFEDFNYTTIECPAPIPCSLPYAGDANATGIVVCGAFAEEFGIGAGFTMCIDPSEALEGDTCGCCGGTCPEPCTGTTCTLPVYYEDEENSTTTTPPAAAETGVWLVDTKGGYAQCVTTQESAYMQLEGFFTCMDACSA